MISKCCEQYFPGRFLNSFHLKLTGVLRLLSTFFTAESETKRLNKLPENTVAWHFHCLTDGDGVTEEPAVEVTAI